MSLREFPEAIESAGFLDAPAQVIAGALPVDGPVRDVLRGRWLGHAVHPMLTDLPIGFWTSSFVLDFLPVRWARVSSDTLLALGNLSAVPTIVTGVSELADAPPPERRVAVVHAAANSIALGCYVASSVARARKRRLKGVILALAGATAATVGGYLGGHLVERIDIGPR